MFHLRLQKAQQLGGINRTLRDRRAVGGSGQAAINYQLAGSQEAQSNARATLLSCKASGMPSPASLLYRQVRWELQHRGGNG